MSFSSVVEPQTTAELEADAPAVEPAAASASARRHPLVGWVPAESRFNRGAMLLAAVAVAAAFAVVSCIFWVPAHGGVDQNGYLVGGRQILHTGTMKIAPVDPATGQFDPHQVVGKMWVGVDYGKPGERFYPKYPIGLPLLVAALLRIGGPAVGPQLVYCVNPIAMTMAVFGTFLLLRPFCGSYLAVLGELVFATSPTTALYGIDDNSHATAVFCVVWGMTGLFAWWRLGARAKSISSVGRLDDSSLQQGARESLEDKPHAATEVADSSIDERVSSIQDVSSAPQNPRLPSRRNETRSHFQTLRTTASILLAPVSGFLLGYAALIRYSEATLIAPVLLAIVFKLARKWPSRRDVGTSLLLLLGWVVPIGGLIAYNLIAMHTPTGYDPTNESKPGTSFTFAHFVDNWETCLRQMSVYGLYFIFPIGLMGLVWMWTAHRRAAAVISAWVLPCMACYTLYYWAPDNTNTGYLRFYLTIFPGLTLCAMWLLMHLQRLITASTPSQVGRWIAVAVPTLAVVAACSVHAENDARELEANQYQRLDLLTNVHQLMAAVPPGAALFANDQAVLMDLQFMQDNLLFDLDTYNPDYIHNIMNNRDPADPQTLDPGRSMSLQHRLGEFDRPAMELQARRTMVACLAAGRRVFILEPGNNRHPRADQPRRPPDWVNHLTAPTTDGSPQLYADVVYRWRRTVVPPAISEVRDDNPAAQPRAQKAIVKPIEYQQAWLVYEVATHPLPTSPEKQAMLDFDQARAAEAKARDDEKAKVQADKQKQMNDQKARLAADRQQIQQLTTARDAAAKQLADAQQQLVAAQKQVQSDAANAAQSAKDRAAAQQTIAGLQKDRDAAKQSVATLQKARDDAEQKAAAIEKERAALAAQLAAAQRPPAATQPSATQPSR